jgi:cellulose synthase/poly-beta-1,6-N-acetylglucosamine synthase-like glycosyltransferase
MMIAPSPLWLGLTVLFWILAGIVFYTFIGYPAVLLVLSRMRPREVRRGSGTPFVSIVTAARNEASCIRATIENKLSLDYPNDRREVIVISDASDDGTDKIVREFADRGVRLVRQDERRGKSAALNLGLEIAKGEIIVFSDANSIYERSALRELVRPFEDPSVGYVTGKMVYTHPDGSIVGEGCSAYMRYENRLREWETKLGSIVGVDGGVDAMRRSLYRPLRADQLPDFVVPLWVTRAGYRVIYEPGAVLREATTTRPADEYRMRVRVALRALWALREEPDLLNPFRFGVFSWQLFSHKVLRYVAFAPLLLLLLVSGVLALQPGVYRLLFWIQAACYGAAALGFLLSGRRSVPGILSMPYYFLLIQVASCHAVFKLLAGQTIVVWNPRTG